MSKIIKPGKYIISDPCYVLNNERYSALIDPSLESNEFDELFYSEENASGEQLISRAFGTAHGDGRYTSHFLLKSEKVKLLSELIFIDVDSGLIGITSYELATEMDKYDEPVGIIIEVLEEIQADCEDGIIYFGPVFINTDPDEDDEDDEDEDDEDDEYYDEEL